MKVTSADDGYIAKSVNFEGLAAAVQEMGMHRLLLNRPRKFEE
jgi:hypothetical protein